MQSFPKPLNAKEEKECIKRLRSGDKEARKILIEKNLRLVAYVAKRYVSADMDMEELISIGSIGLIKGIDNFKEDKQIRLATFCSKCIEIIRIRKSGLHMIPVKKPLHVIGILNACQSRFIRIYQMIEEFFCKEGHAFDKLFCLHVHLHICLFSVFMYHNYQKYSTHSENNVSENVCFTKCKHKIKKWADRRPTIKYHAFNASSSSAKLLSSSLFSSLNSGVQYSALSIYVLCFLQ